jgi:FixJ family two-component response regulator
MSKECPFIAVVDDEEGVRTALRRLLQSAGLAVQTFSGGAEFLSALNTHRPDCAVLDVHMPDMTGFDVLARMAETRAGVPVIVITGHGTTDAEELAMRGGAAAYLRKPINDRVLLDAISAAIANSRTE